MLRIGALLLACLLPGMCLAQTPLQPFAGTWRGHGTAELSAGKAEKIRCNGYNSLHGSQLKVVLTCAQAGGRSRFEATISGSQSGALRGSWKGEFDQSGSFTGIVQGAAIRGRIASQNFKAAITVSRAGNTLSIRVTPDSGPGKITVSLAQ